MTALDHINEILNTLNDEITDIESVIIDKAEGHNVDGDPGQEFAQYVEHITGMLNSIKKCKRNVDIIASNPEKLKFAHSKLTDNGDLMMRLDRLNSAIDELEYKIAVKEFDFRTIDNILDIIDNELSETTAFHGVKEVRNSLARVDEAKCLLKREIFRRYRELGVWYEIPVNSSGGQIVQSSRASTLIDSLRNANIVVDTLGEETVTDLLETLVQVQILPYQLRGGIPGGDLFGLDKEQLERRWEELYRLLGSSSAPHIQRITSSEWDLTYKLYVLFCRRTAVHLQMLLDIEVNKLHQHGRSIRARTAESESSGDSSPVKSEERVEIEASLVQEHGNFVVQVLKSVLAIEQEVHKMFDDGVFAMNTTSYVSAQDSESRTSAYRCTAMSSMFDNYLDPFVKAERRNVQSLIQSLVNEDVRLHVPRSRTMSTSSTTSPNQSASQKTEVLDLIAYTSSCQSVFNSAEMLFQTIRSSLLRCASFTTGKPLVSLSMEYKVCFQIYAETLRTSLCPTTPPSLNGRRPHHALSLEEEILACRSVVTAERCIALIPQMQSEIALKIQTDYARDVNMRAQVELFEDVSSHGVDVLVGGLLGRTDEVLVHMVNTPWAQLTSVGDCSPYIRMLNSRLSSIIPRLRKVLSWKCFEMLCYRFSGDFLDHFLALIMGLKKICVVGAEQLLLDLNELKPMLLKLHHMSLPSKSYERQSMPIGEKYVEMVGKKARLIEVVLKLICSDDDQIEETFYIMWPDGQDGDLRTIKNLKVSGSSSDLSSMASIERKSSGDLNGKSPSRLGDAVESFKAKAGGGFSHFSSNLSNLPKFKLGKPK